MTNKLKIVIAALAITVVAGSCFKKDDSITILDVGYANDMAYLKFINVYTALTPSAATPAAGPSVNVFINDVKINAAAVSYGGLFPAAPAYTAVQPALGTNIKVIISRATAPVAGDTLINKNYDLGANSYTTVYLTDSTPNPTPQSPYFLPFAEQISNAKVGYFKARFVNMIPSTDTLEVFSKRLNAVMFPGTRYKNASDMIEIPTFLLSDTLQLRKVSAPATILGTINGFTGTSARVYTVYCTGNITATPRARLLTSFTNR
ncbi:MAG: DUF4397 domain-containing protein [Chitinophagaceae bacterium]|nr:DUF4397 domain-containing protein [Chitinophagaceae bacterium]